MISSILKQASEILKKKKKNKRLLEGFICLAVLVALGTVTMLILTGRALTQDEKVLECHYEPHRHTDQCYGADGALICGKADFVLHKHGESCYGEDGSLVCTLPEIEEHIHDDSCYRAEGEGRILVCGKSEIRRHTHTAECYEESGNGLICTLPEVEEHVHDENCFVTVSVPEEQAEGSSEEADPAEGSSEEAGPAGDNSEESGPAGINLGEAGPADGNSEEAGPAEDNSEESGSVEINLGEAGPAGVNLEEAGPVDGSSEEAGPAEGNLGEADSTEKGTLKVTLLYGDAKTAEEYPDGYSYYTHSTMSGFIKLEPSSLTKDLEDVTVTLTIPKKYVEENTVRIPGFTTDNPNTVFDIPAVREDEDNYYASIHFTRYDQTHTLQIPFDLSFKDDIVPDNYKLPVTAEVTRVEKDPDTGEPVTNPDTGDPVTTSLSAVGPIYYKPLYKEWGIKKFVNSNRQDAFAEDGAEVVVTSKDPDGNPYLSDTEYVEFYFRVNRVINQGSDLADYRDASSVTLTDTLPSYVKTDGTTAIAVFDSDLNEGWTLSDDGKRVSKTYTGTDSHDVLLQIYNDAPLKLQFPGLKFETDPLDAKNLIAEMDNTVDLVAIPSNEATGESRPTATDPLHFKITTDPGTVGRFTKQAMKGVIYDIESYKINPYPWRIRVSNDGMQPLEHIQINDKKIEGENGLGGLDDRLKFVKLESDWKDSIPAKQETITDAVEKVIAYYTDGSKEEFYIKKKGEDASDIGKTVYIEDQTSKVDSLSNFTVEFDTTKECDGYDIIFKADYKMQLKEAVSFKAYTVYRDPEGTVVPKGTDKLTFTNSARAVNSYKDWEGTEVFVFLTGEHCYDMLPVTETLSIEKKTCKVDGSELKDAVRVGGVYTYYLYLRGSLMTPEQKPYGKFTVIDLLPDEVEWVKTTNGWGEFDNEGVPQIIENYKNSGRTALLFTIDYDKLTKPGQPGKVQLTLSFKVQVRETAHSGTITNYAYVVGEDLLPYAGESGGTEDIYDLNENGLTTDMVAYDHSPATIEAAASIYAEKFIAPAGTDNWTKQGLFLKTGMDFDYKLKVVNELEDDSNLVIYDTLPGIDDRGVLSGSSPRNSEFRVQLRDKITAEGYMVYYTDSPDVYGNGATMAGMVNKDIWKTEEAFEGKWSEVTAFKLVANEGTKLEKGIPFEVRIPAKVPDEMSGESMDRLEKKTYEDQQSGTMAYLEATNNFGFTTAGAKEVKESNSVWVRIPFAGFTIQKVDQEDEAKVLTGAKFKLTREDGTIIQEETAVDGKGRLSFRNLTEGTYVLTETQAPTGYKITGDGSLKVTITQNPVTMEYTVTFSQNGSAEEEITQGGNGTNSDPLRIGNKHSGYVLPATGGGGVLAYTLCGLSLIAAVCVLLYIRQRLICDCFRRKK